MPQWSPEDEVCFSIWWIYLVAKFVNTILLLGKILFWEVEYADERGFIDSVAMFPAWNIATYSLVGFD